MSHQFLDRQIYGGTIVDQAFFKTKAGKILFKFVVSLDREVENAYKGVSRPLPANYEKDVVLDFNTPDQQQLTWRMADLQRLGFKGTDVGDLAAGSATFQDFRGTRVMVSVKLVKKGEYTNEYWNLFFPKKQVREGGMNAEAPVSADDVRNVLGKHFQAAANRATARDAANAGEAPRAKPAAKKADDAIPF